MDDAPEPGARRFPAIVDTGLNHNFAIRRLHLDRWTGLRLPARHTVKIGNERIPLAASRVWLHPNRPGTAEPSGAAPVGPKTAEGIAVYPDEASNPARLPILGLRALVRSGLTLVVAGRRREVTLKTPGWF